MSDIFISYAKEDRKIVEELAKKLDDLGYAVWWDRTIVSGQDFEKIISEKLERAEAVIVIWTANSITSDYVRYEVNESRSANKLIAVKETNFDLKDIPVPFNRVHTEDVTDLDAIEKGLYIHATNFKKLLHIEDINP